MEIPSSNQNWGEKLSSNMYALPVQTLASQQHIWTQTFPISWDIPTLADFQMLASHIPPSESIINASLCILTDLGLVLRRSNLVLFPTNNLYWLS